MTISFEGQVALVTGGSTGIGAAVAKLIAERGARVTITGRHEETLRASAGQHQNIGFVVADVADPAGPARAVEEVKLRHGRLDVLVNNAAVAGLAPLGDASAEHVRRTFDVNVFGLVETTRLALPLLRQSKGAVVNVTSTVADRPFANMSAYSASKAAVLAFTRAWAKELAPDGVRVNAVSPGPIDTPMVSAEKLKLTAAELEAMGKSILELVPLRRYGKPIEVAQVIAFLASPAAAYVTGAEYTVGGGIEA